MNLIPYARQLKGMRQQDLAERLGINRITVANIERESKNPSLEMAFRIARELGQPVDELFNVDEASVPAYKDRFRRRLHGRAHVEVIQTRDGYSWRLMAEGTIQVAGQTRQQRLSVEYEASVLEDLLRG